jgi:hypothetical protein
MAKLGTRREGVPPRIDRARDHQVLPYPTARNQYLEESVPGGVGTAIPFARLGILDSMASRSDALGLRSPADPQPPPIKEPPDAPENPNFPGREPDPEEPNQI